MTFYVNVHSLFLCHKLGDERSNMRKDLHREFISISKVLLGSMTEANSSRGSSQNDCSSRQRGSLRQESDNFGDREDQIAIERLAKFSIIGRKSILDTTILQHSPILNAFHPKRFHIRNQLLRHNRRPNGTRAIETLAETPLALSELRNSGGNIIRSSVTEDVIECLIFGHIFAGFSNDDHQFGFVVTAVVFQCPFWDDGWGGEWIRERGCGFHEDGGKFWEGEVGFFGVFGVLQILSMSCSYRVVEVEGLTFNPIHRIVPTSD